MVDVTPERRRLKLGEIARILAYLLSDTARLPLLYGPNIGAVEHIYRTLAS